MKRYCKPGCNEKRFVPHYSFHNLEGYDDERYMHNRINIFYESTDYLVVIERSMQDDKGMFVYMSGVWIVYTGMSIAAVIHAVSLLGYIWYDRRIQSPLAH